MKLVIKSRTRIFEYVPPPPPPLRGLVTALNKRPYVLELCKSERVECKQNSYLAWNFSKVPKLLSKIIHSASICKITGLRNNFLHANKMYYTTMHVNGNLMGRYLNYQRSV